MPHKSRSTPRALVALALLLTLACGPVLAEPAPAAPAENPYEATVKVDDESGASRDKGLRLALIEVLRRAVGRNDSATSPILGRANSLVQSYRFLKDEASGTVSFRASFDPSAINSALRANGLPVFGVESDVIEAWITEVRGLRGSADYAAVLQHFGRLRGVKRVDVEALSDQTLRLRMVVEGGVAQAAELAAVGGPLRSDGAGGYVIGP